MGVHGDQLDPHELRMQLKVCPRMDRYKVSPTNITTQCLWAAIPQYNASLGCSKFSILFQYLRIFPDRRFRLACFIVMGIVALYTTWAVVSAYVNCVPVARFWDKSIDGTCLSFEAVWFFNASMNIATDVALLFLPMPLLSQLQLPRLQKIALMGVFAVGILYVSSFILSAGIHSSPDRC